MSKKIEVPSEYPGKFSRKEKVTQLFFDSQASNSVDRAHWKIAFFALLCFSLALVATIYTLVPLKTVKIYRLEVDKLGAQNIVPMATSEYEPSLTEVRARIKEMTEQMFAIDRLMKKNLTKVELKMSGQAKKQFKEFLINQKQFARLAERPDLFREVVVSGVSKISDKVLLVDFSTKERMGQGEPITKRYTMTVSYEIKPATTDEEVLGDNPSGIYIVSFTISELN